MRCPQCDAQLSREPSVEETCPHCAADLHDYVSPNSDQELTATTNQSPDPDLADQPTQPNPTGRGDSDRDRPGLSDGTKDKKVGRYFVQREVGRGGMGVVYKARDERLGRSLALKIMRGGADVRSGDTRLDSARFLEEARLSAQLDHPGLVPVHDLEQDPQLGIYFTMRLVKGKHLGEIFRYAREKSHGWNLPRAIGAIVKACDAIAYAHSKKVIHRDLKPSNIMVGRFGAVYVMDWGLAKVAHVEGASTANAEFDLTTASQTQIHTDRRSSDQSSADTPLITMEGSVVGTPAYMPPEQAKGMVEQVDDLSDIYSIGSILYQLLTGHPPYVEPGARLSRHTILGMVIQGPPTRIETINPQAPAELVAICNKAMARDKKDRYAGSLELAEDLQAYLDGRVVRAYRTGAVAEFKSWVSRNRGTAVAALAVLVTALATLAGIVAVQSQHNREIRTARKETRRYLFDSNMQMVQQAWDNGGVLRARELLDRHRPRDDEEDIRSFAWYYFDNLCQQASQAPRLLHDDIVTHIRFAPNGKALATGCNDGTVRIWDTETWTKRKLPVAHTKGKAYGNYGAVDGIVFGSDSNHLVSNGRAGDLFYRSLTDDEEPIRLEEEIYQYSMKGDAQNRFVGAASRDRHKVFVWRFDELSQGKLAPMVLQDLANEEVLFGSVHFLSNPDRVYAMGKDGLARVWSLDDGKLITTCGEGRETFNPLVHASSDGRRIAKTSGLAIEIYDMETGKRIDRVTGPARGARQLYFSNDGEKLAASGVSDVGDVLIWRVNDDSVDLISSGGDHGGKLSAMDVIPGESDTFATAGGRDNVVYIRGFETGEVTAKLRGNSNEIYAMDSSPDGSLLASGGRGQEVRVWDLNRPRPNVILSHDGANVVWSAAISQNGETVVTSASDGHVRIWDAATGQLVGKVYDARNGVDPAAPAHSKSVQFVGFPPAGTGNDDMIVSCGRDKAIRLWSLSRRTLLGEISPAHEGGINGVVFSPDGKQIFSSGDDGMVYGWNVSDLRGFHRTKEPVYQLGPIGTAAWGVAYDSAANVVAAGGITDGHDIHYWNLDEAPSDGVMPTSRRLSGHRKYVTTLQFSPDGKVLASASHDGSARLWDLSEGKELSISPLRGHSGDVRALAFSNDGRSIMTGGSSDRSIRIWDSVTGESKCSLHGHTQPLHFLILSADDSLMVSTGWDGTARLWRAR